MAGTPRWNAAITQVQLLLEQTEQEMQSYYDDRSEEWQAGSRGEELLAKIECIQSARSELPELH